MSTENTTQEGQAKEVLTISSILNDLQNGLERKEIAKKYDITLAELKIHFLHPKLKGKKTIKAKSLKYTLVDDTEDSVDTPEVLVEGAELASTSPEDTIELSPEELAFEQELIEDQSAEKEEESAQAAQANFFGVNS